MFEKEDWINYKLENGQTIKENLEETLNKYLQEEPSEDSKIELKKALQEYLNPLENLHYVTSLDQARQYFEAGGLCLLPIEIHGKLVLSNDTLHYEV